MVKILVTGANGQLGSAISRLAPEFNEFQFSFSDLPDLDLLDYESTEQKIVISDPSYIINCAAYTAVDQAEEDKEIAFNVNAGAVENLGRIAHENRMKLIHISTDYVFNGENFKPYHEDNSPGPVSVYGNSKLKGEEALQKIGEAMVIRTSWLYSDNAASFVGKIMTRSKQQDYLKVVYDQIGSPTYAPDLANAILEIIRKIENKTHVFVPGIFHYTNEGVASWYDFAIEILKACGSDCPVIPVESHEFPSTARRPHYSVLSKQKIRNTYDLKIPHWRDGLERCMREMKVRG